MDISLLMTAVWLSPAMEDTIFPHIIKFIIKSSSILTDIKQQKKKISG